MKGENGIKDITEEASELLSRMKSDIHDADSHNIKIIYIIEYKTV